MKDIGPVRFQAKKSLEERPKAEKLQLSFVRYRLREEKATVIFVRGVHGQIFPHKSETICEESKDELFFKIILLSDVGNARETG